MKKFFITTICICFTIGLFAQSSMLTLSTTGNSNLKVRLNGKRYSFQDRNVTFQNLTPGVYPLTIYQLRKSAVGGFEYVEVFNNNITLKANKHLEVSVLRFGKVAWDENAIVADDWADSYTNPIGNTHNSYSGQGATAEQFAMIKKTISDGFTDDDKMGNAKLILKNNMISVQQVRELTKLFFYEDNKLSFLKYAYDRCWETAMYFSLVDLLFYEAKKKELMEFIGSK